MNASDREFGDVGSTAAPDQKRGRKPTPASEVELARSRKEKQADHHPGRHQDGG
jgi:hypothetical protein